jgi:hypothetical protein
MRAGTIGSLVLVAALAGCAAPKIHATPSVRCPGAGGRVPVEVHADDPTVQTMLRERLEVSVECFEATYDPLTEQGRWPHRIDLKSKPPAQLLPGASVHELQLTHLERKVRNSLDRAIRDDTPATSIQEFKLDMLRADLKVALDEGGEAALSVSFPCTETLWPPSLLRLRARSGVYTVTRTYTGEVMSTAVDTKAVRHVPARLAFDVEFVTPDPAAPLGNPETATRQAEWAGVADTCVACRALVICESLGHPGLHPVAPKARPRPDYHTGNSSAIHVMAGLERRPVAVDSTMAPRKRTVACTRWTPQPGTTGTAFVTPPTDGTDEGLPPATPYLTVHHVEAVTKLTPGTWLAELMLAEVLDEWSDLIPPGEARGAGARSLVEVCAHGRPVFQQTIKVP